MEREILIANTKTQKRSKINSNATTLAELKAELTAAGIDYSGMTFTEGISKTQLLDDATQLPSNVLYKGQPTNNLVILLTNTKKNIASGISTRQEAYELVKEIGLQEEIKEIYGRNFTQVSTHDLWVTINNYKANTAKPETVSVPSYPAEEKEVEEPVNEDFEDDTEEDVPASSDSDMYGGPLCNSLYSQLCIYAALGVVTSRHIANLKKAITELEMNVKREEGVEIEPSEPVSTSDGSINDDDIDDMINDIL